MRETACGFNNHPRNLLLDPLLDNVVRPVSNFAHDWMHTMVVHGVFNVVGYLLLAALMAVVPGGIRQVLDDFQQFVSLWTLPNRLGCSIAQLVDVFSRTRWSSSSKAKYLKLTASEALSLYGIMACYVQNVYLRAGVCEDQCMAFLACCDVIDNLMCLPHGSIGWAALQRIIETFLQSCLVAGWRDHFIPKFHWTIHLFLQFRRWGLLLSCFVHERKHRMVKRWTGDHKNNQGYERSILAEICCQHLADLHPRVKFLLEPHLLEPTKQCTAAAASRLRAVCGIPATVEVRAARRARVNEYEVSHVRDVVLFHDNGRTCVGELWFFFASPTMTYCILSCWTFVSMNIEQGTLLAAIVSNDVKMRPAGDVITSCSYRRREDGHAQVIVPLTFRGGPF